MDSQAIELQTAVSKVLFKLRARPLLWDTITTTGWSTLGKAAGFLIPFFIAAWFGISSETDAFFFAYGLILFLSLIFAPVVESLIVPYVAEMRSNNEDVGKFLGRIAAISGVWLFLGTAAFILFLRPILSLITRFDEKALILIYQLLIETAPLFILLIWTSLLSGAINAYKKFAIPAISPVIRAGINLALIFSFKDLAGVHSIAWGYVAGELARLVILFWATKRLNLFKLVISYSVDPRIKEFLRTMSYQTIGMVAVELNPIVDKTMASWLGKGSVSILEYAGRLYMIPMAFISGGLLVTVLSHWSSGYYESGQQRLKSDVKTAVKVVGVLTLVIMLFLIGFHHLIVRFAFGRGVFDEAKVSEVGSVWMWYLLGFVPTMVGLVYVRAYLILKKTRLLMQIAFFSLFIHVLWNLILMNYMGVRGIALSTSVTMCLTAILQYIVIRRYWKRVGQNAIRSF